MPTTSKSKWAQLKVGLMAMVALLILAFLIILMTGRQSVVPQNHGRLHLSG